MRVLLLAAGFGTRLRPLTDEVPKCLVPVKGIPLLEIWLKRLTDSGFGPFIINTHYLAQQVKIFVANSYFRNKIKLVYEPNLLGTAGTLNQNSDFFQGQGCMLIHADNYCLADLVEFRLAHLSRPEVCVITMLTFRTNNPSSCGIVEHDSKGVVQGFHEKVMNPPGNLANGAVYILSPAALEEIKEKFNDVSDFSTGILPYFVGRIYSHETKSTFIDIGTPESYALANSTVN